MASEKILVVDDEPEISWLFSKILGEEGYQVLSAKTGKEAFSIFKRRITELNNSQSLQLELPIFDNTKKENKNGKRKEG